jgi:hypothetical protein
MTNNGSNTSLRTAALRAGFALLVMVIAAPFVELFAYPKLVVSDNVEKTIKNITDNKGLFVYVIFGYLLTFVCDIVVAWALYILLKPVNKQLSFLTALFRWVYTIIALIALLNLVTVFRILNTSDYSTLFQSNEVNTLIMFLLKSFKSSWYFGFVFFSIHLILLGYLVIKSSYVPGILGILLIITGLGYLLTTIKPYLFSNVNIDFARYTFYGELVFMLWLLIKGWSIKEVTS